MKILAAVGAILSFILALYLNYLPQTEAWTGNNIGEVSDKYRTLITPASYAFSIWGIIYLSMISFLIFQSKRAIETQRPQEELQNIRLAFILLHLLNAAWIVSWSYEYLLLSVFLISGMLASSVYILRQGRATPPRDTNKRWVQYPFEIYTGWLTAATVANISVTIQSYDLIPLFMEGIVALIVLFIVW
jgi:hypothetical protein